MKVAPLPIETITKVCYVEPHVFCQTNYTPPLAPVEDRLLGNSSGFKSNLLDVVSDTQPEQTNLQALAGLIKSCLKMIVDLFQLSISSNPLVRWLHSVIYQNAEVGQERGDSVIHQNGEVEQERVDSAVHQNSEVEGKRVELLKQRANKEKEIQELCQQIKNYDIDIENGQEEKGKLETSIRVLEADIKELKGKVPVVQRSKSMGAHKGVKKNENSLWSRQQEAARKLEESEEHIAKLEQQSANLKQSKRPSLAQESIVALSVRLMKLKEDLKATNTKISQIENTRKTLFSQLPEKKKELEAMAWWLIRPDCEDDDMRQFRKEFSLNAVSCA